MCGPAAGRQLADLARIERGLSGKVEAVEVAHAGKVSDLHRHLDAPLVLARDLTLAQEGQRLAQTQLASRRLVDEVVELIADGGKLQSAQPGKEHLVIDAHRQPPPATRSYSANGRSNAGVVAPDGSAVATGRAAPATPWKCAASTIRCRRPVVSAWAATS